MYKGELEVKTAKSDQDTGVFGKLRTKRGRDLVLSVKRGIVKRRPLPSAIGFRIFNCRS